MQESYTLLYHFDTHFRIRRVIHNSVIRSEHTKLNIKNQMLSILALASKVLWSGIYMMFNEKN